MKLEEGEVICSKCKGRGCYKCKGKGKLDWVSNMMGEKPIPKYSNGNVCIGYKAGHNLTTGSNNVCIGYKAGYKLTTETDQVCIGDNSEPKT